MAPCAPIRARQERLNPANSALTKGDSNHEHFEWDSDTPNQNRSVVMNLTTEQREQAAAELKRFGADLQLSDDQKQRLHEALAEARAKLAEYLKENPNTTKADIAKRVLAHRTEIRERLVAFLNPEQLKKWDAEIGKAKEFLGQTMAA